MEGKHLARIGAIMFVAFAITAAVIGMTRKEEPPRLPAAPALALSTNPLRAEQRRCQQLGEAAANDPECLRVWAETRDSFLGRTPSPAEALDKEH